MTVFCHSRMRFNVRWISFAIRSIFAPTTVVWLVDISPSAMSWGSEIHSDVRRFYAEVVPTLTTEPDRLQTGVMTISRTVEFRVKRTTDPQAVVAALDAMRIESSGRETTFEAVKQALDEYLPLRIRERREVVFVIITDEAGDDWAQVDRLVEQPRKYALPIYVVGVPAPLGRTAALDPGIESSTEGTDTQAAAGANGSLATDSARSGISSGRDDPVGV